jgi:hypothetical protein
LYAMSSSCNEAIHRKQSRASHTIELIQEPSAPSNPPVLLARQAYHPEKEREKGKRRAKEKKGEGPTGSDRKVQSPAVPPFPSTITSKPISLFFPAMVNLTRPTIILPFILVVNLLFATYFLGFTLNPLSAPQPYRSLLLVLIFYGCTLLLSLYFVSQSKTLSAKEKADLGAYLFSAETALALVWWFGVLFFTPSDEDVPGGGKEVEWWTTGRGWTLAVSIPLSLFLIGGVCAERECILTFRSPVRLVNYADCMLMVVQSAPRGLRLRQTREQQRHHFRSRPKTKRSRTFDSRADVSRLYMEVDDAYMLIDDLCVDWKSW